MGAVLSVRVRSAEHEASSSPVLGEVSFDLARGETVALTGPSGIGKTTLLRLIAGLHRVWSGKVDKPAQMAMVFQEPTLLPWRSVLDNLTIPTGCAQDEAEQLLAEVGLQGTGARFPATLSLGQQRRLALARAFAAHPELLLMDEPFVSLDAGLASEMMDLFETMRQKRGAASLIVTHSAEEAARLADRVLRLAGRPAVLA
ncbi:MAG: hypothetical protein RLZZ528_1404 [Pseudomonadota bacterium]|jgi:NitT/TauT family transport system ATP-binding protein